MLIIFAFLFSCHVFCVWFFSLPFTTTSRLVSPCKTKFRLFASAIILSYIFACTKTLTLFLSRSLLFTAVNQFIQMCVVHRKLQTSNTSLILKFRKLQFIKIRATSSVHATLMNSHMLLYVRVSNIWNGKRNWIKKKKNLFGFHLLEVLIVSLKLWVLLYEKQHGKLCLCISFWFHFDKYFSSINLKATHSHIRSTRNFIVCNFL